MSADYRKSWSQQGGAPAHYKPTVQTGPGPRVAPVRSGGATVGGFFRFLVGVALLGGAGWAAWKYGKPFIEKFRVTSDAEMAANSFLHELPVDYLNEVGLSESAKAGVMGALTTHASLKSRWFVGFAPGGDRIRVARDDSFAPNERAFVDKFLADAEPASPQFAGSHDATTPSLGAMWKAVPVAGKPWRVVVAWVEKPK